MLHMYSIYLGDEALDVKIKRSVCHSYTVLLLLLIVRHAQDVSYLQKYGQKLLLFSQQGETSHSVLSQEYRTLSIVIFH